MKFSARGEYGVRVMVGLARHYGAGPRSLAEIAAQERMPLHFLEQIIAELRVAGLVTARRGRRGGYELSRPPQAIRMGEIVGLLEGGISPMVCIPGNPALADDVICAHQDYCTTRVLWLRVRDSIVQVLETTTLADLMPGAVVPADAPAPAPLPFLAQPVLADCHDLLPIGPKPAQARVQSIPVDTPQRGVTGV
ncbi:MAG: Rrf2 family transcriptional regulator [Chloroflexi bacterium]|nr:Rrf2 family transcriptional regulator [Chloroflexota bacterium]